MIFFLLSVGVTPKVGINMTEGATIGLGMKLNIEGRHFKPNEKVKSYEVQPHVKSFKVGNRSDHLKIHIVYRSPIWAISLI